MARKGENIYKRKDGRWEARYEKGRNSKGQIIYGSLYGKSYREVREKKINSIVKLPVAKTISPSESMNILLITFPIFLRRKFPAENGSVPNPDGVPSISW